MAVVTNQDKIGLAGVAVAVLFGAAVPGSAG
jgi:hypothetical protein